MERILFICILVISSLAMSACGTTGGETGSSIDGERDLHIQADGDKLARTNIQLGVGYMQQGKYEFALNKMRKGLSIDDSLPDGHYAIALLYELLNKPEHARRHFTRAIELNPQYSDARNAYGVFLCRQKEFEAADMQFSTALKNPLYKSPLQAMLNAGVCLMESDITDRYARAEKYFRIVLQRNPNIPEALLNMSKLSVKRAKYLPGRAYLQRYQAVGKHTAETLWLGIQIEENLGDKKTLAAYKRQLRNDFPDSEEAGKLGKN